MKKILFYIAAVAMAASCNEDMIDDYAPSTSAPSDEMVYVNLNLNLESSDTRVSVTPGESESDPWITEWVDGDNLYVYNVDGVEGYSNPYSILTYVAEGNEGGTFSGYVYPGRNRIYTQGQLIAEHIQATDDESGYFNFFASSSSGYDFSYNSLTMISTDIITIEELETDYQDGWIDMVDRTIDVIDVSMQNLQSAIDLKMSFTNIPTQVPLSLTSITIGNVPDDAIDGEYAAIPYIIKVYDDIPLYEEGAYYTDPTFNGNTIICYTPIEIAEEGVEYSLQFPVVPFTMEAGQKLSITFSFNNSTMFDYTSYIENTTGADFYFTRSTHHTIGRVDGFDLASISDDLDKTWLSAATPFADTSSTGIESDPIEIASEGELAYLAMITYGYVDGATTEGIYYELTNDLDLAGKEWMAIGDSSSPFRGFFDGGDHTISNMTIDNESNSYQALFGYISGGEVSNLKMKDPDVVGYSYCGAVCGYSYVTSFVSCSVEGGSIYASSGYRGGIVGQSYTLYYYEIQYVTDCHNINTTVYGGSGTTGGVIGYATRIEISGCSNSGSISNDGSSSLGGICGGLAGSTGSITNCYNTGTISGGTSTGGIVGYPYSLVSISKCYNKGDVSGTDYVGGIAGRSRDSNLPISQCYNTGAISGSSYVGGIIGHLYTYGNSITACYNTGAVSATTQYGGGVVGSSYDTYNNFYTQAITACYNMGEVTGGTDLGGVLGYDISDDITVSESYYLSSTTDNGFGTYLSSVAELNAKVDDMNAAANSKLETTGVTYFTEGIETSDRPTLGIGGEEPLANVTGGGSTESFTDNGSFGSY